MTDERQILKNFIVLEGLDGSGTTTQRKLLTSKLRESGETVFETCEPSPLPTGKIIRRVLEKDISVEPETLARMFSADRYEHLYGKADGMIKHLNDGEIVISDRYLFSSLAYQSLGCGFELVMELNPFPLPEYLVYVDVTPDTCRERMSKRELVELFDGDDIQMSIVANYERGIAAFPGSGMKVLRIDGHQTPTEICSEILSGMNR